MSLLKAAPEPDTQLAKTVMDPRIGVLALSSLLHFWNEVPTYWLGQDLVRHAKSKPFNLLYIPTLKFPSSCSPSSPCKKHGIYTRKPNNPLSMLCHFFLAPVSFWRLSQHRLLFTLPTRNFLISLALPVHPVCASPLAHSSFSSPPLSSRPPSLGFHTPPSLPPR